MKLIKKSKNVKCRVCDCTPEAPCPKNLKRKTCRGYDWTVEGECAFCTNPRLRLRDVVEQMPRLIIRTPRFDTHHIHRFRKGWRVQLTIAQLKVESDNRSPRITRYFTDNVYGGRIEALFEAVIWRDHIIMEFNLGTMIKEVTTVVETTTVETVTIVNKFEVERDVDYPRQHMFTNRTQMLKKLQETLEKQRERERVKPLHDGVSRRVATSNWADTCSKGQIQMSTSKRGRGKW